MVSGFVELLDISLFVSQKNKSIFPNNIDRLVKIRHVVDADIVAVMLNTEKRVGSASLTLGIFTTSRDRAEAPLIMAHEIGHALFGLLSDVTDPHRSLT